MIAISENHPLLPYNTFGLEATAAYWGEFGNTDALRELLDFCREKELPWYVISGGSNVILTGHFPGMILHPVSKGIEILDSHFATNDGGHATLVKADAGVEWDDFVAWTVERNLGGIENLSYIPGYVGASPVQNIGAYGAEVKDTIQWVEYLDTETLELREIAAEDCRFGYRESIFKHELRGKAIVTAVVFRLTPVQDGGYTYNIGYGDLHDRVMDLGLSLEHIREAVTAIRKEKLPDPAVNGNAGSFFKNPMIPSTQFESLKAKYPDIPSYPAPEGLIKVPAAWLIDRAGWKGFRAETVGVHPKQALVVINLGGATAHDILALGRRIIEDIHQKFGIEISMEVNIC